MSAEEYFARDPALVTTHPEAAVWVRAYFHGDALRGVGPFTGGFFDDLGHRGEPDPAPDELTPADLLALEMLDARVAPAQIPWLLEDPEIGRLLARIPFQTRIWEDILPEGAEPWPVWAALRDRHGLGEATATKVLARKRPHLAPVVDEAVVAALQPTRPGSVWLWEGLRERFRDSGLRDGLTDVAIEADVPGLPLLRVLDAVIRMRDTEVRLVEHEAEMGPEGTRPALSSA
ncbi:MAG: hypothetical protein JOZ99_13920 [Actinobacteria bacterium]|nr:hypothetical protein [Actinomycetota bacterium]